MKNGKKKMIVAIIAVLVLALIFVTIIVVGVKRKNSHKREVSVSYEGTDWINAYVNIPLPEDVVPAEDVLIANLEKKGYTIEKFDTALNSDIPASRVLAKKGKSFIDICYGLDATNANEVFSDYKDVYLDTDYYILAQNGYFEYCVSDKKTVKRSGFNGTANVGVQYKK